jgi:DNA-binding protein H-NS
MPIGRVKKKMKRPDLKSMSVDELWSVHELVVSVLVRKMSAEKARLDQQLRQLDLGNAPDNVKRMSHARRPYPH